MAYNIKTTSPERYRVRPSLGLIAAVTTIKIEVFYQPINPDSDDFSDVLKDKFLINLFMNSSDNYKNEVKDRRPSCHHRLKACVKKSLLKIPEKKDVPTNNVIDKDKDIYLKEVSQKAARESTVPPYLSKLLLFFSAQSFRHETSNDARRC